MKYRKKKKDCPIFTIKDGKMYLLMILIMVLAAKHVESQKPLVSPAVDIPAAYAQELLKTTEIKKEDTRWFRLFKTIRWYESNNGTRGLAVTCKNKGKINEIGYLPYSGYCFDNESEQETTIANWMNKRINFDGLTDSQLLCLWNTGKAYTSCAYSRGQLDRAN